MNPLQLAQAAIDAATVILAGLLMMLAGAYVCAWLLAGILSAS